MAAILDFSQFTFTDEQIRAVKELVFDEVIKAPEIDALHTIYPSIVFDKEVGFIGKGGEVGVAGNGCTITPQAWNIGTRKIVWEPKEWEILIHECRKDLEATAAVYSLNSGVAINDFTNTDYMAIVTTVLTDSIKRFIIRLFWFNDVDAEVAVVDELPTAAVSNQSEDVPESTLSTQPAVGEAIIGTVYEGNATKNATYTIKTALHAGTVVYLKAAAATGNVLDGASYYEKSATETVNVLVDTLVGTVYAGVAEGTPSAVTCALSNGTVVYLAGSAATGTPNPAYTYYTKDTVNKTAVFSGGTLTPGTTEDFFTIINGFFKQMLARVVVNPAQLVNITANEGATYTAQTLDPSDVQDILKDLYFKAPLTLRGLKGNFIVCTQAFYDAYELSLTGTSLAEMYYNLTDSIKVLKYKSIPLIPMQIWDDYIAEYYNDGYKYTFGPNIAILTNKSVLACGVDSMDSFGDLQIWYSKDDRKVKIEGAGKADAKLANPALFQIAI